jgi:glutathione synthase/RimK-type ligase-like ATP-grasp enzyme
MRTILFRRDGLGRGSCNAIRDNLINLGVSSDDIYVILNNRYSDYYTDCVIRWGCTGNAHGTFTINKSRTIHLVNDKIKSRQLLQESGISVPETVYLKRDILLDGLWIGRPRHHSQGRNAVMIRSVEDIVNDTTSEYWTRFIPKEKEYRIYCMFGRVVCVAEKIVNDPNAILWNHAQGASSFVNVRWSDWPLNVCHEALKAQKVCGIDFTGIDVMVYHGRAYILELNSAPSLTSPYRQKCFALGFKFALEQLEEGINLSHFVLPEIVSTYRDVLHPAIYNARERIT